jgi:hypothetical protein
MAAEQASAGQIFDNDFTRSFAVTVRQIVAV